MNPYKVCFVTFVAFPQCNVSDTLLKLEMDVPGISAFCFLSCSE